MLREDADALRCDLAETYHVYDLEALPVHTVALLACGLRENSRIMQKITGAKAPDHIMLLAVAVDQLSTLVWMQTKDGRKGRNRPKSLVDRILHGDPDTHRRGDVYDSPEEFWAERQRIIERSNDHA